RATTLLPKPKPPLLSCHADSQEPHIPIYSSAQILSSLCLLCKRRNPPCFPFSAASRSFLDITPDASSIPLNRSVYMADDPNRPLGDRDRVEREVGARVGYGWIWIWIAIIIILVIWFGGFGWGGYGGWWWGR